MSKASITNSQPQEPFGASGGDALPPAPDTSAQQQTLQRESLDPASREARIRNAAYHTYLGRAGAPGDEVQDWLDAEAQVDDLKD